MTGAGSFGRRVVVVSDETLVAETVSAALRTRGFDSGDESSGAADAGLLIGAMETYGDVAAARALIAKLDVPWLVVSGASRGPVWGALLESGASRVVESSTSIEVITATLDSLIEGTLGGDPALELDLRRQWRAFEQEREAVASRLATLTPWELTILRSLHAGQTVSEFAAAHRLAEDAVTGQVEDLLARLDLGSQLAAVERLGELFVFDPVTDPRA